MVGNGNLSGIIHGQRMKTFWSRFGSRLGGGFKCARVDQLPLFPYNRGWETQPNSVGVYIPIIRIPIKDGMTISNIATFDHGTFGEDYHFDSYFSDG